MKKPKSQKPKLNPITPEALVHIADLVERDNGGLEQRCVRYRRRVAVCRYAMAACPVVLLVVGLLWRQPAEVGHPSQPLVAEQSIIVPSSQPASIRQTSFSTAEAPLPTNTDVRLSVSAHSSNDQTDSPQLTLTTQSEPSAEIFACNMQICDSDYLCMLITENLENNLNRV